MWIYEESTADCVNVFYRKNVEFQTILFFVKSLCPFNKPRGEERGF